MRTDPPRSRCCCSNVATGCGVDAAMPTSSVTEAENLYPVTFFAPPRRDVRTHLGWTFCTVKFSILCFHAIDE